MAGDLKNNARGERASAVVVMSQGELYSGPNESSYRSVWASQECTLLCLPEEGAGEACD